MDNNQYSVLMTELEKICFRLEKIEAALIGANVEVSPPKITAEDFGRFADLKGLDISERGR